ncbi:hypothetical protein ABK040_015816 [Willaertia magna]
MSSHRNCHSQQQLLNKSANETPSLFKELYNFLKCKEAYSPISSSSIPTTARVIDNNNFTNPITNNIKLLNNNFSFHPLPGFCKLFPQYDKLGIHNTNYLGSSKNKQWYKIIEIPIFEMISEFSNIPYFNYDLKFHYEFSNFSFIRKLTSITMIASIGLWAKFFLNGLNKTTFYGKEKFRQTIVSHYESVHNNNEDVEINKKEDKKEDNQFKDNYKLKRGLLTVINHNSMLDEPILMSGLCPLEWFYKPDMIRYAICARDMCFSNPLFGELFKTVKVMPITRSGGLEQNAMKLIKEKLSNGGWVNIFPEGRIYVDGEIHTARRGVGKLIYDCEPTPYVYPIYHKGLADILPYDGIVPRIGKDVTVMFGDEIKLEDIIERGRKGEIEKDVAYILITKRIEESLRELKRKCEKEMELNSKK